ncbi:MAG: HAMP domain-containing histidine kinase [Lachnospiraceae bacterium]|nr:HAMP domain-containing histidine kinase [Lachnospiraceae bacterium]
MRSNNIFKSFRFEIVLSSLLAMLYTLLTEVGLGGIIFLIYRILKGSEKSMYTAGTASGSITNYGANAANSIGSAAGALNSAGSMAGTAGSGGSSSGIAEGALSSKLYSGDLTGQVTGAESGVFTVMAVVMIAVGIFLFIVYFMLLTRRFSSYLTEIGAGIERISTGDLESRIEIRSDDELGWIAESLNRMADEIKELMAEERSTENTKNELITSVAHDLRTPLTSILGYLDLAASGKLNEETRQKYISIAYSKSKRLEKLIEDLFSFTKLTSGEMRMNIQHFDLVKMMEQMIDEFYPSFQDNHLECEFLPRTPQIMMDADADKLARAFANLISNAVKYGAAGKNIRIEMEEKAGKAVVSVTNYGELIPEKDLANIFNRFYRVENSRSSETGGSGLGLAIARSIVEMHEGSIGVKSDFDGTVFTVVLPIKDTIGEM